MSGIIDVPFKAFVSMEWPDYDSKKSGQRYDPTSIEVFITVGDNVVYTWKFEEEYDWYDSSFEQSVLDMGISAFADRLREVLK